MSVNGDNYNPKQVSHSRFGQDYFKRVVTKQNKVYWYKLTSLYTWRKIDQPTLFGKLESQYRDLQYGI